MCAHTHPLNTHAHIQTRRYSPVLLAARSRGHYLLLFVPQTTLKFQPNDVQGFDTGKEEVANIKAVRNVVGDCDRYVTANIWVCAISTKW